eukprot:TRINITY_DN179_c0_g1_i5.p1 TRINITY_DN179_c0_g1~~TRINITY_DN179_c0_g1_i5.p1  ORF type:complete len:128 (-),score=5.05 TRINITY_DN179_c0_g1_i5:22-405(-)
MYCIFCVIMFYGDDGVHIFEEKGAAAKKIDVLTIRQNNHRYEGLPKMCVHILHKHTPQSLLHTLVTIIHTCTHYRLYIKYYAITYLCIWVVLWILGVNQIFFVDFHVTRPFGVHWVFSYLRWNCLRE